jgi:hypothetical protein
MVWVGAGVVVTGYLLYATTQPFISADVPGTMLIGWAVGPAAVQVIAVVAMVAWLTLPLPVLVAGVIRLRGWRQANLLRVAGWVCAWLAGAALMLLAKAWANSPRVNWGELVLCAGWLGLGILMTWMLAGPAHGRDVFDADRGERVRLPAST